jgi:26S proteasome regulatory subunit N4
MTRARIIHLRNDYKSVMSKLETAVHEQFAAMAANPQAATQQSTTLPSRPVTGSISESDTPFATVDEVAPNGPAHSAGLQVGDKIIRFGSVNWFNHDRLRKIGEVVMQNEGVSTYSFISIFYI